MGLGARMLRSQARRPDAAADRARVPRGARARVHRARRDRRGHAVRRRRGAAAVRATASRTSPSSTRCWRCSSAACRCSGVLSAALDERDIYVRIGARERGAGAAVAVARGRQLRPAAAQPRHGLGDRPDADGLRARDHDRARGGAASSRASSKTSTRIAEPMPRDYYEVLGVGRDADEAPDQEGVPPARARAAPGRQRARPGGRGEVQGGRRGLRGALGRRAPPHVRRLRPRGPAAPAATRPNFEGFGSISDLFCAFFGAGGFDAAFGRDAAARRRDAGRRRRRRGGDRPRRRRARHDASRSPTTRPRAARPATATAPSPARRSSPARRCHGAGPAPGRRSARASASSCAPRSATTAAATAASPRQPCETCGGRGHGGRAASSVEVDVPAGHRRRPADPDHRPRPRRRARRPERRPLRGRARPRGRALPARRART